MSGWGSVAAAGLIVAGAVTVGAFAPTRSAAAQTALLSSMLNGLDDKEERAEQVWALRAGLNVAALQCQFSRYLATVPTYNALLQQHSGEFADSFRTLTGYFVRKDGNKIGQRAFDSFATRMSQSWATFDAQLSFCDAAAAVGRRALRVPKGKLAEFASLELPMLRKSLLARIETPPSLRPRPVATVRTPDFSKCDRQGRCHPFEGKGWFAAF